MVAFIYVAGRGLRLRGADAGRPKILLEFGGKSLLEWHALRLARVGVRDIVLVSGYRREQVAALIPGLQTRYGTLIQECFNGDFTEGSVLSVQACLPELRRQNGSVLFMDGDVLYPTAMLKRLLDSPHVTALLLDRGYSEGRRTRFPGHLCL
jgi:choline kinase